jgi:pimeloyl-ACP methyl ester carboxylesterase
LDMRAGRATAVGGITLVLVAGSLLYIQLPAIGAGGLLHPARTVTSRAIPDGCIDETFEGDGVSLRGWRCQTAAATPRGTILYLHGIADNRGSAAGVVQRFAARGFDVVAFDSRAHGESSGDACTYGYFEKRDLRKVIDVARAAPIILIGTSLGAAVALQEAADDPRVSAIIAAETFSDLRTVATERAPRFFTRRVIQKAFVMAEDQSGMVVDDVSPENAARWITARVLLIHGEADVDTLPAHSQRVYAQLRGDKQLLLVPGAHHNESLNARTWNTVEQWLDGQVSAKNSASR